MGEGLDKPMFLENPQQFFIFRQNKRVIYAAMIFRDLVLGWRCKNSERSSVKSTREKFIGLSSRLSFRRDRFLFSGIVTKFRLIQDGKDLSIIFKDLMIMKVLGINHIGIAAKDPAKTRWFFKEILQLPFEGEELVPSQKTNTIMFHSFHPDSQTAAPNSRLEILVNQEGEEGPIQKFIDQRGGGIHHLAITVENLEEALERMRTFQVKMIDEQPRSGAHHTKIAFVHPHATGGILVELVEETNQ